MQPRSIHLGSRHYRNFRSCNVLLYFGRSKVSYGEKKFSYLNSLLFLLLPDTKLLLSFNHANDLLVLALLSTQRSHVWHVVSIYLWRIDLPALISAMMLARSFWRHLMSLHSFTPLFGTSRSGGRIDSLIRVFVLLSLLLANLLLLVFLVQRAIRCYSERVVFESIGLLIVVWKLMACACIVSQIR